MAGKIQMDDDDAIVDINITPFVDVVLVLLVVFMVTAQFMVGRGINVELPTAQSSEVLQKSKNFVISILKDETYMMDGKVMTLNEIQKSIDSKTTDKSAASVTINADKSVPYNSLVQLMDALRLKGISNFALQMNPSRTK